MEPMEREDHIQRHHARREVVSEEVRILMGLAVREGRIDLYKATEEEYRDYKAKLRKQVREHHKLLDDESEDEDLQKIEDKIFYGSDTDSDYEDAALSVKEVQRIRDKKRYKEFLKATVMTATD